MYLDSQLQFSNAQAVTSTADSTNVVDLGVDHDIGKGEPMAVVITVGVAADFTTGDETYNFIVETDDNAAMTSSTIIGNVSVLTPLLTAGDKVVIPLGHLNERFLQVVYTTGGTTPTITVDAYLIPMSMIDGVTNYADGFNIT